MVDRLLKYAPWIPGILSFAVYWYTLAPSVVHIDSGELAAVQATLGIAHPTGYPLFTLIGHAFLWLPLPGTVIYRLNLLCALWCAGGVVVMGMIIRSVLQNADLFSGSHKQKKTISESPAHRPLIASIVLGGLFLGFSKTYWLQSTSVEVYSLHVFLLLLTIHLSLSSYYSSMVNGPYSIPALRRWYSAAIVIGLGFSNHMSILFVLPAVGFLFFIVHPREKKLLIRIALLGATSVFIVIVLYSYILLRANNDGTQLIWSLPKTLRELIVHVGGIQYSGLMFESKRVAEFNALNYFRSIPYEFAIAGIVLSAAGLIYLAKHMPRAILFIVLCLVVNIAFAVNYRIRDIYTYYLLSYAVFALSAGVGIYALLVWTRKRMVFHVPILACIVSIICALFYLNGGVSHRNLYTYEDYTKTILGSVEPNAIILSSESSDWELFVSSSLYFQYVEKYRPDVVVVESALFRTQWFHTQLERSHPGFFDPVQNSRRISDSLYAAVVRNLDEESVQRWYRQYQLFVSELIEQYAGKRPIYFTSAFIGYDLKNLSVRIPSAHTIVPDKVLFKLVPDSSYHALNEQHVVIRLPKYRNAYIRTIEKQLANVMASRASYEASLGHADKSKRIMEYLPSLAPDISK